MLFHKSFGAPDVAIGNRADDLKCVMGGQIDLHNGTSPRDVNVRRRMIERIDSDLESCLADERRHSCDLTEGLGFSQHTGSGLARPHVRAALSILPFWYCSPPRVDAPDLFVESTAAKRVIPGGRFPERAQGCKKGG